MNKQVFERLSLDRQPTWPQGINTWHDWLKLWESANTFQEAEGLLHRMFDYFEADNGRLWADKVRFCLMLADGVRESHPPMAGYRDKNEQQLKHATWNREQLRKKAFSLLSYQLFSDNIGTGVRKLIDLDYYVMSEMLNSIFWFFRTEHCEGEDTSHLLPNFARNSDERHQKQAISFILILASAAWGVRSSKLGEIDHHFVRVLHDRRAEFVPILNDLGRLDILMVGEAKIDESSIDVLSKLAFETIVQPSYRDEPREPLSVDEAVFYGSQAANVLVYARIMASEDVRIKKIAELAKTRDLADRQIREMTPPRPTAP